MVYQHDEFYVVSNVRCTTFCIFKEENSDITFNVFSATKFPSYEDAMKKIEKPGKLWVVKKVKIFIELLDP